MKTRQTRNWNNGANNPSLSPTLFSFPVCYAKNFGPTGIGFGGLTQQVEKKEWKVYPLAVHQPETFPSDPVQMDTLPKYPLVGSRQDFSSEVIIVFTQS